MAEKSMRFLMIRSAGWMLAAVAGLAGLAGCASAPGSHESRKGDEMVVAGQMFHTGTPIVLWMDPGGYDAYRVERRFTPFEEADWQHSKEKLKTPNRYSLRQRGLTDEEIERFRGGGWDLAALQKRGWTSLWCISMCAGRRGTCFKVLQDARDLSVHFMLDIDGDDLSDAGFEGAGVATRRTSNDRSVGIEIANMGSYGFKEKDPLAKWYHTETNGPTVITVPTNYGPNPVRDGAFHGGGRRGGRWWRGSAGGASAPIRLYAGADMRRWRKLTAALCRGVSANHVRLSAG